MLIAVMAMSATQKGQPSGVVPIGDKPTLRHLLSVVVVQSRPQGPLIGL